MRNFARQVFLFLSTVLAFAPSSPVVTALQLRHGASAATTSTATSSGEMQGTLQAKFHAAEPAKVQKPSGQIDLGTTTANSLPEAVDKLKENYGNLPRWLQIVICVVGIVVGLVLVFAGYHFFRLSVFLITGSLVGVLMFVVLDHSLADSVQHKAAIVYGVSLGVGLLAGVLAVCLIRPAVFAVGAAAGVLLAVFLNPVALKYVWPENPEANLYIWMGVFAVTFGILVLFLEKFIMIAATAVGGSFLVIISIGEVVGDLPKFVTQFQKDKPIPGEVWAYIGGWAALFIIGVLVQMFVTAKKDDHGTGTKVKKGGKGEFW